MHIYIHPHALTHFRAHPSARAYPDRRRPPRASGKETCGCSPCTGSPRSSELCVCDCALDESIMHVYVQRDRQTDRQTHTHTHTHTRTHTHTPPRPLHHEHVLLYNYICQAVVQSHFDDLLQQNDGLFQRKKMQKLLKTKASCKYGTYFSLKWS